MPAPCGQGAPGVPCHAPAHACSLSMRLCSAHWCKQDIDCSALHCAQCAVTAPSLPMHTACRSTNAQCCMLSQAATCACGGRERRYNAPEGAGAGGGAAVEGYDARVPLGRALGRCGHRGVRAGANTAAAGSVRVKGPGGGQRVTGGAEWQGAGTFEAAAAAAGGQGGGNPVSWQAPGPPEAALQVGVPSRCLAHWLTLGVPVSRMLGCYTSSFSDKSGADTCHNCACIQRPHHACGGHLQPVPATNQAKQLQTAKNTSTNVIVPDERCLQAVRAGASLQAAQMGLVAGRCCCC